MITNLALNTRNRSKSSFIIRINSVAVSLMIVIFIFAVLGAILLENLGYGNGALSDL